MECSLSLNAKNISTDLNTALLDTVSKIVGMSTRDAAQSALAVAAQIRGGVSIMTISKLF